MNQRIECSLALAAVIGCAACMPAVAAAPATDPAAAESAVRRADVAWAASAGAGNVDAWMAFTTPDAIQALPGQPLASGAEAVRGAVGRLLSPPTVAVEWHAAKVAVAASGDLAEVQGTYVIERAGPGGATLRERGRVVELWKRQADGTWKCSVDSWSPDDTMPPAVATSAPPASAAPVSAPVVPAPAAQAAPPAGAPAAAVPAPITKYGDAPVNYLQAIRQYFQEHLKDPESIQYQEVSAPEQGSVAGVSRNMLMSETRDFGWIVRATINARDSHGAYVGAKSYRFLFRGERMIRAMAPLPSDEFRD